MSDHRNLVMYARQLIGFRTAALNTLQHYNNACCLGLIPKLLSVVPEDLSRWANSMGRRMLYTTLKDGDSRDVVVENTDHMEMYGFSDLDEFEGRFQALSRAWSGIIRVQAETSGRQLNIFFSIDDA